MKYKRIALITITMLLAAHCLSGCRAVNRTITEKAYEALPEKQARFGWVGGRTYKLDDESLAEIPFEGAAEFQGVQVSYQNRLGEQAQCIAEHLAYVTQTVGGEIALEFTHQPRAYLLRVDEAPDNVKINLKVDPNSMPLPLFVEAGREDWRTILADSTIFPYAIIHEITEASLVMPREGKPVAPDLAVQSLVPLGLVVKNYTRWFRDGLANYAGYIAFKASAPHIDYSPGTASLHRRPFSALAKVGDDLFKWHQYSDESKSGDYYNAALGLFLLIEHRYGSQAIRDMVVGKDALEFADGAAMIELANATLQTDIEKLAENFDFPQTGLGLAPVTRAAVLNQDLPVDSGLRVTAVESGSMAEAAAIQKDDVITHVAGLPIEHQLDFERAIFEHLPADAVPVTVRRGQESITWELKLAPAK